MTRSIRTLAATVAALALGFIVAPALGATPVMDFRGPLMRPDGQIRCTLNNARAQCVSMRTGRVIALYKNGSVHVGFTRNSIYGGRVPAARQYLVARSGLGCTAAKRYVTCLNPMTDSGFTMDGYRAVTREFGFSDSPLDDSPPAPAPVASPAPQTYYTAPAVTAPVYTAPVYTAPVYTAPVYVPAYQPDPGNTYGLISPTTGLPRTHYVSGYTRADGTYVNGYYRSCSTC